MIRLAPVAALLATFFLASCGKDDSSSSGGSSSNTSGSSGSPSSSSGNAPGLDASKDLSADLKKLMEATYSAAKSGDSKLAASVESFILPGHEAWLKKTFGDEMGAAWAKKYSDMLPTFKEELAKLFDKVAKGDQSGITVYYLTNAEDPNATGSQKDAMKAMKEKSAIYTVKFIKPGEDAGMSVWSWAYVDGGFRLIGKRP
jgi:hypothetical protein